MDSSSLYCRTCSALNDEDAQSCFACGKALLADTPTEEQQVSASEEARARPEQLKPHQLLRQRYRILKQIGEGGFGAVYRAEDTEADNRLVAIKEMQPGSLSPQELLEATETFHREARFLAELSHPSLCSLPMPPCKPISCAIMMESLAWPSEHRLLEETEVQASALSREENSLEHSSGGGTTCRCSASDHSPASP